jgi:hypothetical protein
LLNKKYSVNLRATKVYPLGQPSVVLPMASRSQACCALLVKIKKRMPEIFYLEVKPFNL